MDGKDDDGKERGDQILKLFRIKVDVFLGDTARYAYYNIHHSIALQKFETLKQKIGHVRCAHHIRQELFRFISSNPYPKMEHNGDINKLLHVICDVINYFEKMDKVVHVNVKGDKNINIGKSCVRDFLGIVWMKITGYYEPMRYFRNSIAHKQYEFLKGDNEQSKILFYNITDEGDVNWKLFCDKRKVTQDFTKFLECMQEQMIFESVELC